MDEITQEYLHIFKSISFTYEDVLDLLDMMLYNKTWHNEVETIK